MNYSKMSQPKIQEMMESLQNNWVTEDEAISWIVEEISTDLKLNDPELIQLRDELPSTFRIGVAEILKKASENNYYFPICTVGGKGLIGNPEILKRMHQIFKL
jgi:hypothetical protein